MFKSSDISYWKHYKFNKISLVFGIGYGFRFNFLFGFLNSDKKLTWFDLGSGCAKYGATHYELFDTSRTPNRTKRPTSFLNIYSCTFSTSYGREHIGFAWSFNSDSNGSVFQVPCVPSNNSSNLCNNFSNSLRCVIVKCWHWVSVTLFKSDFFILYLMLHVIVL